MLTIGAFHLGVSLEPRGTVADCLVVLRAALSAAATLGQCARVHAPAVHARLCVRAIVHGLTEVSRTGWCGSRGQVRSGVYKVTYSELDSCGQRNQMVCSRRIAA